MNRSYLFIPGNQPNMLQNAFLFDSDALVFDLEDSVHAEEKDNARNLVKQFLIANENFRKGECYVRLNGMDTPFFDQDIIEMMIPQVDGFVIPKATKDTIKQLEVVMYKQDPNHGKKIIVIIESALGLIDVEQIASRSFVHGCLLGAEDYSKDLELIRSKQGNEIAYARSRVVNACVAFHKEAIDTPFVDVFDDAAFEQDAIIGKSFGMTGKSSIHPRHVEGINRIFSPSKKDIQDALELLQAVKMAEANKIGAFSHKGKMVDRPIIDRAEKVIEKARKYGLLPREANE